MIVVVWATTVLRTILNLALVPRLRTAETTAGPLVSVIIPARDEAETIERTVRAFLAQTYASLEVVVVNDRSTDGTAAILERLSAAGSRLRVVAGAEPPEGWLGKPWAVEQGCRVARGEILLIVDADILYEPHAVAAGVEELERSGAAMLTFLPRLIMSSVAERIAMPQLALSIFSFLPTWLSNRTTIRLIAIGGGVGNLVRREDYEAVGGQSALRNAVVDDVALARLLRRHGRRTIVVRAEHLVSVRIYGGLHDIILGFTKNMFAVLNRSYVMTAVFVMLIAVLHLYPYAAALTGDVMSIVAVALITLTRVIVFASLRYPLHYALWAHPPMMLLWSWIAVRSMWITGVRGQLAWRGRSYDAGRTRFGA